MSQFYYKLRLKVTVSKIRKYNINKESNIQKQAYLIQKINKYFSQQFIIVNQKQFQKKYNKFRYINQLIKIIYHISYLHNFIQQPNIMLQLTRQNITQSFLQLGYSQLDYLYLDEIQKSLQELNHQQFDKQTLQQLQNQCTTNSRGQIKLDDLISTFLKAQQILVQRDLQIKRLINKLQQQVNQANRNNNKNNVQIQQLEQQIYQTKEQQISNQINLEIIRKPFAGNKVITQRSPRQVQQLSQYSPHQRATSQYASVVLPGQGLLVIANTHTFTWIFQLTILLIVLSLPCMFYLPCNMNMLLLPLIVLNIVSGYFCRIILRVWMFLIGISIAIDIVWFIVGIKPFWLSTADYPAQVHSYLRFTVILYGVVGFGKLLLFILLASEYNTDQSQKKIVSVFGFCQLQLSHDQVNKNFFPVLNKGAHNQYFEDRIN